MERYSDMGGNFALYGYTLDGAPDIKALTLENIDDIKTILAYDYEDGKPCHDKTCVMEIHFHNYQENIENNKLRILYNHPGILLSRLSAFMLDNSIYLSPSCPFGIKIDLTCSFTDQESIEEVLNKDDFEEYNCRIVHKKRFHPENPDMPWD